MAANDINNVSSIFQVDWLNVSLGPINCWASCRAQLLNGKGGAVTVYVALIPTPRLCDMTMEKVRGCRRRRFLEKIYLQPPSSAYILLLLLVDFCP